GSGRAQLAGTMRGELLSRGGGVERRRERLPRVCIVPAQREGHGSFGGVPQPWPGRDRRLELQVLDEGRNLGRQREIRVERPAFAGKRLRAAQRVLRLELPGPARTQLAVPLGGLRLQLVGGTV